MTSPKFSLADRWNRYWYLETVGLWLDPLPRKHRKAILAELRDNLDAAATDVGMSVAIEEMGRPRALARQYLDAEPAIKPTWSIGFLAVVLGGFVWLVGIGTYTIGMLDALQGVREETGRGQSAESSYFGINIAAEASDQMFGAAFTGISWITIIALLLVFSVFSRAWRLPGRLRQRKQQRAAA